MVRFRDYAPSDIVVALEGMEAHAAAAREYKQASAISEAAREIARARAALQELVSQEARPRAGSRGGPCGQHPRRSAQKRARHARAGPCGPGWGGGGYSLTALETRSFDLLW